MADFIYTATVQPVPTGGTIKATVTAASQADADAKLNLSLSGGTPPTAQPNPDVKFELFVAPSAFTPS